ncbi:hypothetical protein MtrunA17_Chr8g0349841 [Medicago truncatula]|uniref:Uncharacterized protein n=1 Tax=Medicago truncatula TaxID=3880 RepID=A0A396GF80_MEDTR|nr:hypothetical protein MtrunA17_Chr8g0349841 [Medicago truncatula]
MRGLMLYLFVSSTPCMEENQRDIGEVSTHKFKSLRSFQDVGMLLDLVNAIESFLLKINNFPYRMILGKHRWFV